MIFVLLFASLSHSQIFGPSAGALTRKIDVFTSSGTWTRPTGIDHVSVIIVGAGGGGARSGDSIIRGHGGGGGCIYLIDYPVTSNVTVTVGTGGVGATTTGGSGTNGGSSCFGLFCALGGKGGVNDVGGPGGGMSVGGNVIYGDVPVGQTAGFVGGLIYRYWGGGAGGTSSISPSAGCTGAGVGISYGKPYAPGMAGNASDGGVGNGGNGQFPGGGGAGATSSANGGNGANGVVVVIY